MRAKFKLDSITRSNYGSGEQQTLKLSPVTSGSAENRSFWRWTPSGSIELSTINPNVLAEMELGREYYVDFTVAAC